MSKLTLLLFVTMFVIVMSGESAHARTGFAKSGGAVVAAQVRNEITGHIFDTARRPIEKVRVELLDDVYAQISQTRTDGSGRYAFSGISAGNYQVKVYSDGTNFEEQTKSVDIVNYRSTATTSGMRGGEFRQVDFVLKVRGAAKGVGGITGTVFAQDIPPPARAAYESAIKDLGNEKSAEQGITGLQRAIDLYPKYFLALERLGVEYAKRQQYEPARTTLAKAVEVNPRADQSMYWLGIAQYKLKQNPAAIETLRRAVTLTPNSINAQMGLGIALYAEGKFNEAETHFKQASKIGDKRIPIVHLHLAQLYDKTKRFKEEANELDLYLQEQPTDPNAEKYRKAIENLRNKK